MAKKQCRECGESKKLCDFPKHVLYRDGHTNKCKKCTNEYYKERYAKKRGKK